jgi:hypothetical protein
MRGDRVLRYALITLGVAATLRGAYLVAFGLPPRVWLPMAIWLAAGSAVHDLLLAPGSLLLGRTLGRVLGRKSAVRIAGNALRGAWLGIGTVLLVGLPLLVGARRRANPTVIPGRPVLNLLLSVGLVVTGASLVIALNLIRAGRSARVSRPAPTAGPTRTPTSL